MKGCTLLALVLLVAPSAASSVSASSAASAWLKSHKSPTDNQLKELAGVNPEAAAIVNALLSNHMKHMRRHEGEESGAEVFRRMMTPPHLALSAASYQRRAADVPYATAEVRAPVIDEQHYDSNAASNRDDTAVSRLLSAVAGMGGSKGKKISALLHKHQKISENPLMEDQNLFEEAAPVPATPKAIEAAAEVPEVQEQAAPAPKRENSYLKGIDLSGDMPVAEHHARERKENSYLKGVDMSGGATDSLATFSFGADSAPEAPAPVPVKVVAPAPKKNNVFLKWLGVVDKKPAPVETPVAAPKVKTNSYLDSVKFFG